MLRLIASFIVALATSAIALLLASALLDDFSVDALTFPVLVVEFAVILMISRAALETVIDKNAHYLSSFVGLIGAFVALLVTNWVSDGLSISGVSTWLFATLIVWGGMLLAGLLFGATIFRRIAGEERDRR